jgi:hypothetical protein
MADALNGTIVTKNKNFHLMKEIVNIIKIYTGEAYWRNGEFKLVRRILKTDERYAMLKKRPRIKQLFNNNIINPVRGSVWFKLPTGKFMVINIISGSYRVGINQYHGTFWEMRYNQNVTIFRVL